MKKQGKGGKQSSPGEGTSKSARRCSRGFEVSTGKSSGKSGGRPRKSGKEFQTDREGEAVVLQI